MIIEMYVHASAEVDAGTLAGKPIIRQPAGVSVLVDKLGTIADAEDCGFARTTADGNLLAVCDPNGRTARNLKLRIKMNSDLDFVSMRVLNTALAKMLGMA